MVECINEPSGNDALPDQSPTLRVMPRPLDTNAGGDIFGGWIMSQVDIAGSIVAQRRAGGRIVTVAVNSFHFREPVFVGDLVSLYADIIRIGHTSITVDVRVFAQRTGDGGEQCIMVTDAGLTYVAIDDDRRPRALPR